MIPKDRKTLEALALNMHLLANAKSEALRAGKTLDEYIAGHPDPDARRVLAVLWEMSEKRKARDEAEKVAKERERMQFELASRDEAILKKDERIAELERLVNRMTEARMRESDDQRRRRSKRSDER